MQWHNTWPFSLKVSFFDRSFLALPLPNSFVILPTETIASVRAPDQFVYVA